MKKNLGLMAVVCMMVMAAVAQGADRILIDATNNNGSFESGKSPWGGPCVVVNDPAPGPTNGQYYLKIDRNSVSDISVSVDRTFGNQFTVSWDSMVTQTVPGQFDFGRQYMQVIYLWNEGGYDFGGDRYPGMTASWANHSYDYVCAQGLGRTLKSITIKLGFDGNKVSTPIAYIDNLVITQTPYPTRFTSVAAADTTTGSTLFTNDPMVTMTVTAEPITGATITGFMFNEQSSPAPTLDDPAWQLPAESTYTITGDVGQRTIWAWVQDDQGGINKLSTSIYLLTATLEEMNVQNVSVQKTTPTVAVLAWTTDVATIGGVIYYESGATGTNPLYESSPRTSHSLTLTNLIEGTDYTVIVVNNEEQSDPIAYTHAVQVPEITSGPTATVNATTVEITFTTDIPARGQVGYGKTDTTSFTAPSPEATSHKFVLNSLEPNTGYVYSVRAGSSEWTEPEGFTTNRGYRVLIGPSAVNGSFETGLQSPWGGGGKSVVSDAVPGPTHGTYYLRIPLESVTDGNASATHSYGLRFILSWDAINNQTIPGTPDFGNCYCQVIPWYTTGDYDILGGNYNPGKTWTTTTWETTVNTGGRTLKSIILKFGFRYAASGVPLAFLDNIVLKQIAAPTTVTDFEISDLDGSTTITDEQTVNLATVVNAPDVAVTGYMVTEWPDQPAFDDEGWSESPVTEFTFTQGEGTVTLWSWVKDDAGVVAGKSDTIVYDRGEPVVSDIQIAATGTGTAAVTWTTDRDAIGRAFYKHEVEETYTHSSALEAASGTSHSVVIAGLVPGSSYLVQLENNSIIDATETAYTHLGDAPAIASGPVATVGAYDVTITWTTATPGAGQVAFGETAELGTNTCFGPIGTSHSFVLTGLLPGTAYCYAVRTNAAEWTAPQSFTTSSGYRVLIGPTVRNGSFESGKSPWGGPGTVSTDDLPGPTRGLSYLSIAAPESVTDISAPADGNEGLTFRVTWDVLMNQTNAGMPDFGNSYCQVVPLYTTGAYDLLDVYYNPGKTWTTTTCERTVNTGGRTLKSIILKFGFRYPQQGVSPHVYLDNVVLLQITPPPSITVTGFAVADQTTHSRVFTNSPDVDVAEFAVESSAEVTGYAVTQSAAQPTEWLDALPETFTITSGEGTVELWAWARAADSVASKSATILFSTAAPVVSNIAVTDNGDGTATATWTTDIAAQGGANYGQVSMTGATPSSVTEAAAGTSHSVVLTGIAAGTNCKIVLVNNEHLSPAFYWPIPWPIEGDANQDCRVNILDLIFIRNKLNLDAGTADNWKADVNQDTRINILDLIYVRNKLNTQCP